MRVSVCGGGGGCTGSVYRLNDRKTPSAGHI